MKEAISTNNVSVICDNKIILENINTKIYANRITSIIGPSGVGKTTLLRSFNLLMQEDCRMQVKGDIKIFEKDIKKEYTLFELRTRVSLLFQKPCIFPGNIRRNVLFGVRHHKKLNKDQSDQLIKQVLQQAHLWEEVKDILYKSAQYLSIGQKQRLCFARMLAIDPDILLLDEPTSSLDHNSTKEIEASLIKMKKQKTIILVSHNMQQIKNLSDDIILLSNTGKSGHILEQGTLNDIFLERELKKYLNQ